MYAPGEVGAHSEFYGDLGFDSIMYLELMDELEAALPQLGPIYMDELVDHLGSVGQLVTALRRQSPVVLGMTARTGRHPATSNDDLAGDGRKGMPEVSTA
jgi:acyl carrier protein